MRRRTFLKSSAIGIGTLAGMYRGVLGAQGESRDQKTVATAHPSSNGVVEKRTNGFRALQLDAGKIVGTINSFQGVNGAPVPVMAGLPNLVRQYSELHVSLVRTHDLMGPTDVDSKFEWSNKELTDLIPASAQRAEVVKAGNASIIFPDMSADPEKPESYNFGPTDKALAVIRASGAEIYYRVGRSYGADYSPPADFDKYADVVKHIAMHTTMVGQMGSKTNNGRTDEHAPAKHAYIH